MCLRSLVALWLGVVVVAVFVALKVKASVPSVVDEQECCQVSDGHEQLHVDSILIVSTLDGQISALDVNDNGRTLWSLSTDDVPLVSGTLNNMKVLANSNLYRVIPSLHGHLYMYNERSNEIRPVPVDATQLLSSSVRFGDDVLAGNVQVRAYGIDIRTGHIEWVTDGSGHYRNEGQRRNAGDGDGLIVLKRHGHTLRAVNVLTGEERWNVSIANHHAEMARGDFGGTEQCDAAHSFAHFTISPPDGHIEAVVGPLAYMQWERQTESPIAQMWHYDSMRGLCELSLFDADNVPPLRALNHDSMRTSAVSIESLMYLGTYKNAPYIMLSTEERHKMNAALIASQQHISTNAYRPEDHAIMPMHDRLIIKRDSQIEHILRNVHSVQPDDHVEHVEGNSCDTLHCQSCQVDDATSVDLEEQDTTCENPINRGWYLYKHSYNPATEAGLHNGRNTRGTDSKRIQGPNRSNAIWNLSGSSVSLVYIVVIALLVGGIVGAAISSRNRRQYAMQIDDYTKSESKTETQAAAVENRTVTVNSTTSLDSNYTSRFLDDFEPVHILGRGGFGVVFECRHRLHGAPYAIKRITLTRGATRRERYLREARALARLDHQNIVRYNNVWLETPPTSWQKKRTLFIYSTTSPDDSIHAPSFISSLLYSQNPELSTAAKSERPTEDTAEESFEPHISCDALKDDAIEETVPEVTQSTSGMSSQDDCSPIPRCEPKDVSSIDIEFAHSTSNNNEEKSSKSELRQRSKRKSTSTRQSSETSELDAGRTMYLYIQMELCSAHTLRDWLQANTSKEMRARDAMLRWFAQITSAVNYVHVEHKLIHRDLKPSNIFFSRNGTIKVGDFGLAAICAADSVGDNENDNVDATTTGVVGTKLYMSPEQERGGVACTCKVDIYALGMILAELLEPFGTHMQRVQVLQQLRKYYIDAVAREQIDEEFMTLMPRERQFVLRLLSYNPDDRPTTAQILDDELLSDATTRLSHPVLRESSVSQR